MFVPKDYFVEELIKSLTKGELKKFSFYTKTISSQKGYLELFEDIRKRKKPQRQKYGKKYSQLRRYLYNVVLESMVQRGNDDSVEGKVFFHIKSANYLLRKQLPDQAYDIVNKALAIVRKNELFGYHLEILELEKQIRLFSKASKYRPDSEIVEEEKLLIGFQEELRTLKLIFDYIRTYKKKYGIIDMQAWLKLKGKIIEMGLHSDESFCKTNKAKFYYYYSWVLLYMFGQSYRTAYDYAKKMLELPKTGLSKPERLNATLQFTTCSMEMGYTKEVVKILSDVIKNYNRGEYGRYERTALQIFYYRSNYELASYVFEGQRDKVVKKIVEVEKGIKRWDKKIPLEIKMVIATALKLGYYAIGDLDKADRYVQFLIDNEKSGLRLDAYEDGLMFHMIFIFEKDDLELLKKETKKIYDYFKERHVEVKDADMLMKVSIAHLFLQYAKGDIDKNKMLKLIDKKILERYKADKNTFLEIEYPYLIWVESKIQNKSYLETASEMAEFYLNNN